MRVPVVGDYVSQRNWNGELYRVVHVDHKTQQLWLQYTNAAGRLDEMNYPLVNNWVFGPQRTEVYYAVPMEDTRDYLDVISGLSI